MGNERTHAPAPKQNTTSASGSAAVLSRLPPAAGLRHAPGAVGKQRIGGSLQRKAIFSQAGDSHEREADAAAASVIAADRAPRRCSCGGIVGPGGHCTACRQRHALQRRAAGPARRDQVPDSVRQVVQTPGQSLQPAVRALMEAHFRRDFSGVQVHRDQQAGASAREVNAHAYTMGDHMVFAEGKYDPDSREGVSLLAHELTHVVQQSESSTPLVQRQSAGSSTSEPNMSVTPPTSATSGAPGAPNAAAQDYDPCTVLEHDLTNAQMVTETVRVEQYLTSHRRGEDRYYDYGNLMRRLIVERTRRVGIGHVWLAEHLTAPPSQFYRLYPSSFGQVLVSQVAATALLGPPTDISNAPAMTLTQFHRFLERNRIEQMDIEEYFARQDSNNPQPLSVTPGPQIPLVNQSYFDLFGGGVGDPDALFNPFGVGSAVGIGSQFRSPVAWRLGQLGSPITEHVGPDPGHWRAMLGERSFGMGNWGNMPTLVNLDTMREATLKGSPPPPIPNPQFENIDLADPGARDLYSVKTKEAVTSAEWDNYTRDFRNLMRAGRTSLFDTSRTQLGLELGTPLTQAEYLNRAALVINADHVAEFKRVLATELRGSFEPLTPVMYDRFLKQYGVQKSLTLDQAAPARIRNYAALQAHLAGLAPADRTAAMADLDRRVRFADMIEAFLQDPQRPLLIGGRTASTYAELQTILDLEPMYRDQAIEELVFRATEKVQPNALTTQQMLNLRAFRARYQQLPPEVFGGLIGPELVQVEMSGGVMRSTMAGGWRSPGAISTATGVGAGLVTSLGGILINPEQHPDAAREVMLQTAFGGAGGYMTHTLETGINAYASEQALQLAVGGKIGPATVTALGKWAPYGRVGSSGVAGGIVAPIMTLASMGIEDVAFGADYTYIDYTAKGVRAAVSGGVSGVVGAGGGAMAAAGAGALIGSSAPIVGTVAGAIIGLGAYYLVDIMLGETVEAGVRTSLGEGGCVNRP